MVKFLEKLNKITVAELQNDSQKILADYQAIKSQLKEGDNRDRLEEMLDKALGILPQEFIPISKDPILLENRPVLKTEVQEAKQGDAIKKRLAELRSEMLELGTENKDEITLDGMPTRYLDKNQLASVPGVGPKTAEAILQHFMDVKAQEHKEEKRKLMLKMREQLKGTKEMIEDYENDGNVITIEDK